MGVIQKIAPSTGAGGWSWRGKESDGDEAAVPPPERWEAPVDHLTGRGMAPRSSSLILKRKGGFSRMKGTCRLAHMNKLGFLSWFSRKVFPVLIGLSLFVGLVIMAPAGAPDDSRFDNGELACLSPVQQLDDLQRKTLTFYHVSWIEQ
jgi:hypothetical protein